MTALFWLLLAVFEFPCSAHRTKDADALQVEPSISDELQQKKAPGTCAKSEEEAIQHLAKLWGYTGVNIKENIANCTNTGKDNTKIFVLEQGFSITCKNGSIVTLAIKKKKSKAIQKISILDLKFSMCGLSELKELLLDGSNISGHLEDLEQWNRNGLTRLSLRWCNIEGDLKHLKNFTNLTHLKLSGGKIRGSLEDLGESHNKIQFLDLRMTSVTGDLGSLKGLKGLWLQNTSVTGDMQILQKSPNLTYLNLGWTKVNGTLHDPAKDEGQELKELIVPGSDVKSQLNMLKSHGPPPFPKLIIVDVSQCNLDMNVWDFVYPIARNSTHVTEFKAANCSLFGDLRGVFSTDDFPLYWKVSVLDLSHNNISSLGGVARECWLDISHNPHLMAINPTYFEKTTLLDIRDTPYSAKADVWEFLEKEDVVDKSQRCAGVTPKKAQENGISKARVLVSPDTFGSDLCKCRSLDLEEHADKSMNCCGCKTGATQVHTGSGEFAEVDCVECFGSGCNQVVCYKENSSQDQRHEQCVKGFTGPLCAACAEKGYRSSGFAECVECSQEEKHWRGPMIGSVAMVFGLALGLSLWFWVWRQSDKNTPTEQGSRFLEFLEQSLLMLTYLQFLSAVFSLQSQQKQTSPGQHANGEGQLQHFMNKIITLDVAWVLDMLSFECMLGYEEGRNFTVVASALLLPALVLAALAIGIVRWGSPFYGLKYAIVVTTLTFQGAIQNTWGNLFWCQSYSSLGWPLGAAAFLRQRPWIKCAKAMDEDPLRSFLLLVLSIDAILLPGFLCVLGVYITRKIKGIQSLSAVITPMIQWDSKDPRDPNAVTLHLATIGVAADKLPLSKADLGIQTDFASQALWIYAASYTTCIADSVGSKDVEVMEVGFGESHSVFAGVLSKTKENSLDVLKVKLTKGPKFQELSESLQESILQNGLAEAKLLSKRLLHRATAKHVMAQGPMKALWIGTRNSFERFADKDPLLCECIWKLLLLCMTKMCSGGGDWQMTWVATATALFAFGIYLTKPFGSRSRNTLGTLTFVALSCTCAISALLRLNSKHFAVTKIPTEKIKDFTWMPTLFVILFFVHLQLMPGDILLQANWLQSSMKHKLGAGKEGLKEGKMEDKDRDESRMLKPRVCLIPIQTPEWNAKCPAWLSAFVQWYRGLVWKASLYTLH